MTTKTKTTRKTPGLIRARVTGQLVIPFRAVVAARDLEDAENKVVDRVLFNLSRLDGRMAVGACEARKATVMDTESVEMRSVRERKPRAA